MPDEYPDLNALVRPPTSRVPQGDHPTERRLTLCPRCGGRGWRDCPGCAGTGTVPKNSWEP